MRQATLPFFLESQAGAFQFRGEFAPVIASPAGAKQSPR
jgi:hypothetical protein